MLIQAFFLCFFFSIIKRKKLIKKKEIAVKIKIKTDFNKSKKIKNNEEKLNL